MDRPVLRFRQVHEHKSQEASRHEVEWQEDKLFHCSCHGREYGANNKREKANRRTRFRLHSNLFVLSSFVVGLSSDFGISFVSLTEFVNFHHKIFDNL